MQKLHATPNGVIFRNNNRKNNKNDSFFAWLFYSTSFNFYAR